MSNFQKIIDIYSGVVRDAYLVSTTSSIDGRVSTRAFRPHELTKAGVPDKRIHGVRIGVKPSVAGGFRSGRTVLLDESKEAQGAVLRARLNDLEEQLENAKEALHAHYSND